MHHVCSECGRAIGLMADKDGRPTRFKCAYTGRYAQPHIITPRSTPPIPESLRALIREAIPHARRSQS